MSTNQLADLGEVTRWARQLAAGSPDWRSMERYVFTDPFLGLRNRLESAQGELIGLVGTQGIGKTAALYSLNHYLNTLAHPIEALHVNWVDPAEQIRQLLHLSQNVFVDVTGQLGQTNQFLWRYRLYLHHDLKTGSLKLPNGITIPQNSADLDLSLAEKLLGRARCAERRDNAWFNACADPRVLLIDLPDYSKTDRRLFDRHLSQINQLWIRFQESGSPTVVVAIQKELIHGHFFFDKMDVIELQPLTNQQMVGLYISTFGGTYPFTEQALVTLSSLSRGVPRRFKRYVGLNLDAWQQNNILREPISPDLVRRVITPDRMAEDLGTELEEMFPRNPESRRQAALIINRLTEFGPMDQTQLADIIDLPEYTLSRLLQRIEPRFVTRRREGSHRIVTLAEL